MPTVNRTSARRLAARALILALPGLLAVQSCAVNPVTGKRQLMLMSESQERQLGSDADKQIVAQYGLVDDAELAGYVSGLGQRMVPVSHRPELPFTFRLLDDSVVNAFALPGGYVYMTRGILAYLDSEAALAGVMGHEVGHVTARHGADRYTKAQLFGLGLGLGSVLSEEFARYANVAGTAVGLLFLKYSRDDERQSDQLGVEYATKIGYDTNDMAEFFRTLQGLSGDGERLPSWASTHPDPGERFETVSSLTDQWQARVPQASYQREREAYLRRLEGLAFGPNPREGFVRNEVFYHPDLAFRFPVPSGWKLVNTKTQVQMANSEGTAAIYFMLAEEASPDAAATAFTQSSGIQETSRTRLSIGGFPAVRVTCIITGESGRIGVESTFIEKDDRVFVFHGVTAPESLDTLSSTFRKVSGGFARVTDSAILRVQPARLKIITASRTAPFRDLVHGYPIPETAGLDLDGLALMNGMEANQTVPAGTLLKVVVP